MDVNKKRQNFGARLAGIGKREMTALAGALDAPTGDAAMRVAGAPPGDGVDPAPGLPQPRRRARARPVAARIPRSRLWCPRRSGV